MTETDAILDRPMNDSEKTAADLAKLLCADAVVRPNEPMARRTTLRVGGPADVYVEPASESDLAAVLKFCAEQSLKILALGRGSNLLVRDGGIRGVVICLAHPQFSSLEVEADWLICGAGARLKQVAVEARRSGLSGFEFLEGIPGTVGGALRMNAGAMGAATFNIVESVRFMDYQGRIHDLATADIHVEYRSCPLFKDNIALSAILRGTPALPEEIERRMNEFSQKRWCSQPAAPSAGCMFKNPDSIPAGQLIDELGLKGFRVGGAMVSQEHGNFIVSDGTATARDVVELIAMLQQHAKAERDIELQTEVQIVGEEE